MYMKDNDAESDKRDVGLPEVYAIATITRGNGEKRPITAQMFIDEHVNDSCRRQASSAMRFPGSS